MPRRGLFHQLGQQLEQLVQLLVLPGPQVIRHAGADVLAQKLAGEAVQRRVGRCHLHQNVGTVDVFLHHAPDASDLPLNAAQAVEQGFVLLRRAHFVAAAAGERLPFLPLAVPVWQPQPLPHSAGRRGKRAPCVPMVPTSYLAPFWFEELPHGGISPCEMILAQFVL